MFRDGRCSRGHDITLPGATIVYGRGRPRQNCRRCYTILRLRYLISAHYMNLGLDPTDTTAAVLTDTQYALKSSRMS